MKKINKEKIICFLRYVSVAVIPLIIFIIEEAFYKFANENNHKKAIIKSHILGYVIMCSVFYLLYGILKSRLKTTITLSSIVAVIMIVNQFKIVYSDNPVFLRDLSFLTSPSTFTDILKENVGGIILGMLPYVIFMVAAFVALCLVVKKYNKVVENKKIRMVMSGVSLAFLLLLLLPIRPINDAVIKVFFEIDEKKNNNTTSNIKYYYQHSFLAGLSGEYLTTRLKEPENYDRDRVEAMLRDGAVDNGSDDRFGKPNIIMVFSESLFDMTVIDEVEFDVDVMHNFHELSEEGMLVNMISPVYGGISCNPEFEMLTGGSIRYFPNNYIPYMNLLTNDNYLEMDSFIGELNNNGYTTHLTSLWDGKLFNAKNVYKYMGVDETEFITKVDAENKKGGRASDDYVADVIIDAFENKDSNPLFYMVLTAENHMPFTEGKYTDSEYDINVKNTTLSEEDTNIIKSYAQGCYDADMQLRKLYDYIQTIDEPTMIVYYGDHLPFLKNDEGEDVYSKLSYFTTEDELTNLYRMYHTQCLVLDNYDVSYDDIDYLGYDLVMTYLTNNMDLNLSPYYRWLYTTIDTLPAANRHVAADREGSLYYLSDLPKDMLNTYKKREEANWYIFVDKK